MSKTLEYAGMTLTVELVTPAIAQKWLGLNTVNRRVRRYVVAQYARAQRNNDWVPKPVAICFDETGRLGNGQHTLLAIVESDMPQLMLIARNVPRESIAAMDVGLRRSIADVAHFVGNDFFNNRKSALARAVRFGIDDKESRSFDELLDAYLEFKDEIEWACSSTSAKSAGMNSAVLSVLVRATYHAPKEKLNRFIEILNTGLSNGPTEMAAIRLRDYCRSLKGTWSGAAKQETYRKAEAALAAFLEGKPMQKVYGTSRELFPLPDELA